ncbi:hypothetical protein BJ508DRAFT_334533 [Ascobolus immersus RN42]|uniref:Uncharacterized protein n=1 Tax=Ascobolus immersus RN42 TaxID=1160509 RepID=A0A3N4HFM1_ASCIM|nr:hypothetical protein BJ508DRAFT_334533 [Ascobolus immersus RN42]
MYILNIATLGYLAFIIPTLLTASPIMWGYESSLIAAKPSKEPLEYEYIPPTIPDIWHIFAPAKLKLYTQKLKQLNRLANDNGRDYHSFMAEAEKREKADNPDFRGHLTPLDTLCPLAVFRAAERGGREHIGREYHWSRFDINPQTGKAPTPQEESSRRCRLAISDMKQRETEKAMTLRGCRGSYYALRRKPWKRLVEPPLILENAPALRLFDEEGTRVPIKLEDWKPLESVQRVAGGSDLLLLDPSHIPLDLNLKAGSKTGRRQMVLQKGKRYHG